MSDYFSDRENGPRARTDQAISPLVWAGLVALVQGLINSGAFPMTAQAEFRPHASGNRLLVGAIADVQVPDRLGPQYLLGHQTFRGSVDRYSEINVAGILYTDFHCPNWSNVRQ